MGTDSTQDPQKPEDKPILQKNIACRVCLNEIRYGAKKCIHCESYLDWRKYFHFNTIIISLLVALISVISASAPVIKSIITPEANVKFAFLHVRDNKVVVLATNTGQRAAVLKEAWIEMKSINEEAPRKILLAEDSENSKDLIFEPEKWHNSSFSPVKIKDSLNLIDFQDYKSCRLFFLTLDLNHQPSTYTIDIELDKITVKQ